MQQRQNLLFGTVFLVVEKNAKISVQCIKLTKPVCLTNVTSAFLKINGGIWLKLYCIVRFVHWTDLFLSKDLHYSQQDVWLNAKQSDAAWRHPGRWPETKSSPYRVSPPAERFPPPGYSISGYSISDTLFLMRNEFAGGEDISRPLVEKVAPLLKTSRNENQLFWIIFLNI